MATSQLYWHKTFPWVSHEFWILKSVPWDTHGKSDLNQSHETPMRFFPIFVAAQQKAMQHTRYSKIPHCTTAHAQMILPTARRQDRLRRFTIYDRMMSTSTPTFERPSGDASAYFSSVLNCWAKGLERAGIWGNFIPATTYYKIPVGYAILP